MPFIGFIIFGVVCFGAGYIVGGVHCWSIITEDDPE
jgi:hypothetical protein